MCAERVQVGGGPGSLAMWGARVVRVSAPKLSELTLRERWRVTFFTWGLVLGLAMGGAAVGMYEAFVRDELDTEIAFAR